MAYSSDTDLQAYQPDILDLGIASFTAEHDLAKADIDRELQVKWFDKIYGHKVFDESRLVASQLKALSVYLVLWKYVLPKLSNWVDSDRFMAMIEFYKTRYNDELNELIAVGIQYDQDGDGTVQQDEVIPASTRLRR